MNAFDYNKKLRNARELMQSANYMAGLNAYAELVKKYPQALLEGEYARAATVSGDYDLAERLWGRIRATQPNTAELLGQLAWEYQNIRYHAKALELYRQAARVEPDDFESQMSLAWVLSRSGSIDDARVVIQKCLALDARSEKARYLAALLDRRENKFAEAEQQFQELLNSNLQDAYIHYSCHAELAHIFDRAGRYDDAMGQLAKGKKLGVRSMEEETERRRVDAWHDDVLRKVKAVPKNILDIWGKSFPARARKPDVSLAFLTGSARSGTTLLERVLDAHPAVLAADESLAFSKVLPMIDITPAPMPSQRLNVLRQRYLNILTKTAGPPAPGKILLDKNPSRTLWLPSFMRAFPETRLLIALRDPRDVVVSLYFQNQTLTNSLSLELLAGYYVTVMSIWLAVKKWDGLNWLETRYEDVVADVGKEGTRVTKFLGLEWDENQARFYEQNQEKPVMSTNYSAVSQPVYQRSAGRWKAYEKHLAPVLPILEPYCKLFGYT